MKGTLIAVIALCAICASQASDQTHFDNHLSVNVHASTFYSAGTSKFVNRNIPAGGSDVDSYSSSAYTGGTISLGVMTPVNRFTCCGDIKNDKSVGIFPRVSNGKTLDGFEVWVLVYGSARKDFLLCTATEPYSATAQGGGSGRCGDGEQVL